MSGADVGGLCLLRTVQRDACECDCAALTPLEPRLLQPRLLPEAARAAAGDVRRHGPLPLRATRLGEIGRQQVCGDGSSVFPVHVYKLQVV